MSAWPREKASKMPKDIFQPITAMKMKNRPPMTAPPAWAKAGHAVEHGPLIVGQDGVFEARIDLQRALREHGVDDGGKHRYAPEQHPGVEVHPTPPPLP